MIPQDAIFNDFIERLRVRLDKNLPGFNAQKSMSPSIREDLMGKNKENDTTRQSAVLLLLFPSGENINILLIKRTIYNGHHSGQVAFPGGKLEKSDLSVFDAALRETEEEVGIDSSQIKIIGKLTPLYIPISNMMVSPIVGAINTTPIIHPNDKEVEYIISVPINHLLDPANKSVKVISLHDRQITAPYYNVSNEMVWGATAMIVSEFLVIVESIQ